MSLFGVAIVITEQESLAKRATAVRLWRPLAKKSTANQSK